MNFRKLAEQFMENSLFAASSISWGVLSTDGKIYHNNKKSLADKIFATGSSSEVPNDIEDNVSSSNYSGDIYKIPGSEMSIRVINKDNPIAIS